MQRALGYHCTVYVQIITYTPIRLRETRDARPRASPSAHEFGEGPLCRERDLARRPHRASGSATPWRQHHTRRAHASPILVRRASHTHACVRTFTRYLLCVLQAVRTPCPGSPSGDNTSRDAKAPSDVTCCPRINRPAVCHCAAHGTRRWSGTSKESASSDMRQRERTTCARARHFLPPASRQAGSHVHVPHGRLTAADSEHPAPRSTFAGRRGRCRVALLPRCAAAARAAWPSARA